MGILILVKRIARKERYTIGHLYINGKYMCDTLEDTDRGLRQRMGQEKIKELKSYGKTAIPTGTYKVDMNTVSPKFSQRSWAKPYKGKIPRLIGVPGFDGVLIHPGNTAEDTLGCILVGRNKVVGKVIDSVNTFNMVMKVIKGMMTVFKTNEVTIKIA